MTVGLASAAGNASESDTQTGNPGELRNKAGTRRRWLPPAVCIGLYVVAAMGYFGHFGSLGPGHMVGSATMDSIEQIWWLAWAAYAFPHWHSLFLAQGQNFPAGENFGVNGSMLGLGVVFIPITKVFGPVVTFNCALRLAPAVSATSMCFVLRRWVGWWPAAFLGGLLYGFSATFAAHANYLFLTFAPLPPLILLLLHEVFVRQCWRPSRTGVLLGVVCALQFFVSTEVLAGAAIMATVGVTVLVLCNRRVLAKRAPYAVAALTWGLGTSCLLLLLPMLFTFAGPQHLDGPPLSAVATAHSASNWLSSILPTGQWLALGQQKTTGATYLYGGQLYLGIPLVALLAVFAIVFRRRRALLYFGALTLASFVLSLGSHVTDGKRSPIPLPFEILTHVPALDGLIADRFALFTSLFASAMFAIGFDELRLRLRRFPEHGGYVNRGVAVTTLLLMAVAALVVIPLVPRHTATAAPTNVPPYFTASEPETMQLRGVVLTYPYPDLVSDYWLGAFLPVHSVLLDQAAAGMSFTVIGGYGWFPSTTSHIATSGPERLEPESVQTLFDVAFTAGIATPAQRLILARSNLPSDLREFLSTWRVQSVVAIHLGRWRLLATHVTAAIGPPVDIGGVTVWLHVQQRLAH